MAASVKSRNYMKQREVLREPKYISKAAIGFDLNADQN